MGRLWAQGQPATLTDTVAALIPEGAQTQHALLAARAVPLTGPALAQFLDRETASALCVQAVGSKALQHLCLPSLLLCSSALYAYSFSLWTRSVSILDVSALLWGKKDLMFYNLEL